MIYKVKLSQKQRNLVEEMFEEIEKGKELGFFFSDGVLTTSSLDAIDCVVDLEGFDKHHDQYWCSATNQKIEIIEHDPNQ